MPFPFGKPVLVMALLATAGGLIALARPRSHRADLVIWTFAESHSQTYSRPLPGQTLSLAAQFQKMTGASVRVELVAASAEDIRLLSLFMSDESGSELPDLCEIEIGSMGKFFRPPIDEIGLLPLNDRLARDGLLDQFAAGRFAPWSRRDPRTGREVIFGIPHDVHPVTITYRQDLFAEAGVDLSSARTWSEFQELCQQYRRWRIAHGHPSSLAMEMPGSNPDLLVNMLLQQHINLIDNANQVHLDDQKVARTVALYAGMVAGGDRIGGDTSPGTAAFVRDLVDGSVAALATPDWRIASLREYGPQLSGELRMMPLPRFDPEHDAPTSTWGGTMIGIPRRVRDPEAAWQLLKFLYLSPQGLEARRHFTSILPAVPSDWNNPAYQQPDDFFGGQKIDALYVELARQVPERYVTPYTVLAQGELGAVLSDAIDYYQRYGSQGLERACGRWLADAADSLRQQALFEVAP